MKKIDRFGGVFWLIFGIFICIISFRLGIGNFHKPAAGFTPLLAGIILIVSGLILILSTFSRQFLDEKMDGIIGKEGRRDPLLALSALFGYVFLLESIGFIITSFIFLVFLFKIKNPKRWGVPLFLAISTVVVSYLVFSVWLKLQFPKGILKF